MVYRSLVFSICLALGLGAVSWGQQGGVERRTDAVFNEGLSAYRNGDLDRAWVLFRQLTEESGNRRTSAAYLMLGKTLFRLGDYPGALEAVKMLKYRFPNSRYQFDARLLMGDCYYSDKRNFEAAREYASLLDDKVPAAQRVKAAERLAAIAKNGAIIPQALKRLAQQVGKDNLDQALLYGEAHWYWRLGWEAESRAGVKGYLAQFPQGHFAGEARALLAQLEPVDPEDSTFQDEGLPRLGLLLPLSGPDKGIGEALLAGVKLASEEMGAPLELVMKDIGYDYGDLPIAESQATALMRAVDGARHLIEIDRVAAIVGPVFSSSCVAVAPVADAAGVPLIAPLAQQNGLDLLGEHIFQLNTVAEVQAQALAEYATLVLSLKTFGILAPLSDYGWNFQRAFAKAVLENDGEVVFEDWYITGEQKDFQEEFAEMRQTGFQLMEAAKVAEQAVFDSLSAVVLREGSRSDRQFLQLLDVADIPLAEADDMAEDTELDSSEIFIDAIDGVLLAVESFDDLQTIAAQLRFHRIKTQLLGNDAWYQPSEIRRLPPNERDNLRGSILVSSRDNQSNAANDFTGRFRYGLDQDYAAFGYDAAKLIMKSWQQGRRSRRELRDSLAGVQGYEGAAGHISFTGGRRTNREWSFWTIDASGRLIKQDSVDESDWSEEEPHGYDAPSPEVPAESYEGNP